MGGVRAAPVGGAGRGARSHAEAGEYLLGSGEVDAATRRAEEELCNEAQFLTSTYRRLLRAAASDDSVAAIGELIMLGDRAFEQSQYAEARAFFETALSHALPLRASGSRILAFQRIGRVAHRSGDLADALHHYESSVRLACAAEDGGAEVVARTGMGNVLLSMGEWTAADVEYRRALHCFYQRPEHGLRSEAGYLWTNLAVVAKRLRRFSAGERYLAQARRLHASAGSPTDGLVLCHQALAEIRKHQGRPLEAIGLCKAALRLAESSYFRANFTADLATYHLDAGLTADALRIARRAEHLAMVTRAPYALIVAHRTRGNILRRMGDESGWVHFERALKIARRTGHRYAEAEVLLDYAPLREMIGDPEEAAAYREHALGLLRELGAVRIETAEGVVEVAPSPAD